MKLYKLCFVFAGKQIFRLNRQSTKELKYMKAKIKYNNNRVDSGRAIHSGRTIQLSLNKSNEQYKCHLMNSVITV